MKPKAVSPGVWTVLVLAVAAFFVLRRLPLPTA